MEDREIISLFFDRSEQAIQQLDLKYGAYCRRLSYNILRNDQDVEECVSDAYMGIWDTVPPKYPAPLLTYLCKIVRNQSVMRLKYNQAACRTQYVTVPLSELEKTLPASDDVHAEIEKRELLGILEQFLDCLTTENRVIFLRRYWFGDTYAEIAGRTGLAVPTVSVRLKKIRNELKEYLIERSYFYDRETSL